jgi:polyphosphate kinase 2
MQQDKGVGRACRRSGLRHRQRSQLLRRQASHEDKKMSQHSTVGPATQALRAKASRSMRSESSVDRAREKKQLRSGKADEPSRKDLKRDEYEKILRKLHVRLVELQAWVRHEAAKICIVFEGRDGAGKGGAIKAITARVSPRIFRVVALSAPTEREKSQMYIQRYLPHLPSAGEVVIFDRSWYNRAGVERVMGFCSPADVKHFLGLAPHVEKSMLDSGIILLKYWLEVSPDEQEKRLRERIDDGRKTWKLSDMDLKSFTRWDDYTRARNDMFNATDTSWAPWFVVPSDQKRRARLNIIEHLLASIPYKRVPRAKVRFPKRHVADAEQRQSVPLRLIDQVY